MARVQDIFMQGQAFATGSTNNIINPIYGGMNGYAPDHSQFLSSKKYIPQNAFLVLMQAPGFIKGMPNPQMWYSAIRSVLEVHVKSFDGFKWGLKAETGSSPVGGDGQVLEEVTGMTSEVSNPTFVWDELDGQPIFKLLYNWMRYGMMDPQTKAALIGTVSDTVTDNLADQYSCSYMVIEPDRLMKNVVQSMLVVNSFPKSSDIMELKRDLTQSKEIKTLNIEFSALCSVNYGNNILAQKLLDQMNFTGANPAGRPSFYSDVTPDVAAAINGVSTGYQASVASVATGNVGGV